MAKQYTWQAYFRGNGPLDAGPMPGQDQSVHTTSDASGITTTTYFFVDSNNIGSMPADWWRSNYSRVLVTVDTTWTATFDNQNNLTINANTKIRKIERDLVVGSPTQYDNSGRNMDAYHYEGETPSLWHYHDTNIAQTKVIGTNINLGNYSFTLPPLTGTGDQGTMYFFNKNDTYQTTGDRLYLGIRFTNIMPPDYRPGAIRDGNNVWQSHNRNNGEAHILTSDSGSWREMRTESGLIACGNIPAIRYNNKWANQRKIGKE